MAITPGGRVGDASPLGTHGPRRLTDYEREIAHALMRKRGYSRSHAIAAAKNAIKRWARGGGKVRPQVRAGAAASIAQSTTLARMTGGELDLSFNSVLHPRGYGGRFKSRGIGGKGRSKRKLPKDKRPAERQKRTARLAQQELARRIVRSQGYHRGRLGASPRPQHVFSGDSRRGTLLSIGAGAFSNDPKLDIALAEAQRRDLDFTPHWKHGWIPLNAEAMNIAKARKEAGLGKGSAMPSGATAPKAAARRLDRSHRRARAGSIKQAKGILARHTTQHGIAKVKAAEDRRKAAEAAGNLHGIDEETRTAQALGEKVIDQAARNEPKITSDVQSLIEAHNGGMDGLKESATAKGDFRLKTIGSLTRKIRDKAKKKGVPQEHYAAEVGDALRYTAVFNNKTMVQDVKKFIKEMEAKGYHFASIENTFARGQAYSGVNMNIVSPTGQIFELQAHTHESIYAKHHIHDDYEIYRSEDPAVTESDKIAAYNRMVAVNRQLIRPYDWQRLGTVMPASPDEKRHREVLIRAAERRLYERGVYKARTGRQRLRVR